MANDAVVRFRDQCHFLRLWLAHPLRVAALAPSSDRLAELMTREISHETGRVLELGAGTGVFTRALAARCAHPSDLTLVEIDPGFATLLESRFPEVALLCADASRLPRMQGQFGAVVSGLPLLSMSPRKVMAILKCAFYNARPEAAFYQFTYGPRCPVPRQLLDRLGLKAVRLGGTRWNLPPAAVYRITRRRPAVLAL